MVHSSPNTGGAHGTGGDAGADAHRAAGSSAGRATGRATNRPNPRRLRRCLGAPYRGRRGDRCRQRHERCARRRPERIAGLPARRSRLHPRPENRLRRGRNASDDLAARHDSSHHLAQTPRPARTCRHHRLRAAVHQSGASPGQEASAPQSRPLLGEAELRRDDGRRLSAALLRIPGSTVNRATAPCGRHEAVSPTCKSTACLEGRPAQMSSPPEARGSYPGVASLEITDFAAVEYFNVAEVPVQFSRVANGCGVLLHSGLASAKARDGRRGVRSR